MWNVISSSRSAPRKREALCLSGHIFGTLQALCLFLCQGLCWLKHLKLSLNKLYISQNWNSGKCFLLKSYFQLCFDTRHLINKRLSVENYSKSSAVNWSPSLYSLRLSSANESATASESPGIVKCFSASFGSSLWIIAKLWMVFVIMLYLYCAECRSRTKRYEIVKVLLFVANFTVVVSRKIQS